MAKTNSQALAEDELNSQLLQRVSEGDSDSFTRLYRLFYAPLTRFAYRYLQSPELIEEVVNDTMMTVWQKADGFRGDSRVSTWIMGILARKCWQAAKRHQLDIARNEDSGELAEPEQPMQRLDTERTVSWGLKQLSAKHQASVELAYGYGYTCEEIAEIMECPTSTVKTRLHHARKSLRKVFDEEQLSHNSKQQNMGKT